VQVRACAAGYTSVQVYYGDVLQLEHVRSQRFAGLTTEDAVRNTNNRCMKLLDHKDQETCCYFKIMPQQRARKIGDVVYMGDDVVLVSMDMDDVGISASPEFAYRRAQERPDANVRLPRSLLAPSTLEVNGCLLRQGGREDVTTLAAADRRSMVGFRVNLFARFAPGDGAESLTTLDRFRMYFPGFAGFLTASCNRDKGETLDALAKGDRATQRRESNAPAHLPYLSKNSAQEPSNRANLSAKSVWRFEPVEALSGDVVAFGNKVRIKHVATNKFLAVSLEAARRCSSEDEGGAGIKLDVLKIPGRRGRRSQVDATADADAEKKEKGDIAAAFVAVKLQFKDCCLVDAVSSAPGGASSLEFVVRGIGGDEGSVPRAESSVRIEHRPPGAQSVYFLGHVDDAKPRLEGPRLGDAKGRSRCGFASHRVGGQVLKLLPCSDSEDRRLSSMLGYIPALHL